jgi:hypothetical protein
MENYNFEGTQVDEPPPFAILENPHPQHLFIKSKIKSTSPQDSPTEYETSKKRESCIGYSDCPGMIESIMTDDSSSMPSFCYSEESNSHYSNVASSYLPASLSTVPLNENSTTFESSSIHNVDTGNSSSQETSACFSLLMQAADDKNIIFSQSKMPVVPEGDVLGISTEIIPSGPPMPTHIFPSHKNTSSDRSGTTTRISDLLSTAKNSNSTHRGYEDSALDTPLLPQSPSLDKIIKAKSTVTSLFEDHESFEISMKLEPECTVEEVMEILGNSNNLKRWCNPIESLIVVRSSDIGICSSGNTENRREREYEGEWIEATTTALETPECKVGYIYEAGRKILNLLGLGSYGRITMFVERLQGKVTLIVGPFSGGIHANHRISVFQEGCHTYIVDRVRLQRREEDVSFTNMFLCGALNSCLSSCLLPPLGSYMDQVATSMARLRVLVESGKLPANIITIAPV